MMRLRLLFWDFELPYLVRDHDYPRGPVGGAAVELLCLANELVALGHDVGIITWTGASDYMQERPRFEILECDLMKHRGTPGAAKYWHAFTSLPSLVNLIRRYRPDYLIQKCAGPLTGVLACAARVTGVPFVFRAANDGDFDGSYETSTAWVNQALYRRGLAAADIVFCQNHTQHARLQQLFPRKQTAVIHDSYECTGPLPAINELNSRRYAAWIGRFHSDKGLKFLLDIATKLPTVEFRIVGDHSKPCSADRVTQQTLALLRRASNVTFLGHLRRAEILPFLAGATVLVSTSVREGFPRTYLESLIAGTPIVTTSAVDPDRIIERHGLGVVTHAHSELTMATQSLLGHPQYARIAEACREYVLANHDARRLASQFVEILDSRKRTNLGQRHGTA